MRMVFRISLMALALGGLAFGQGAGNVGANKKTEAQKIREQMNAGPGYVQSDYLKDLQKDLVAKFGDQRGGEMMNTLQGQDMQSGDVVDLMNGDVTHSEMQDLFGAKRQELPDLKKAVDTTVEKKNKKMFFGIMLFVMVKDMDVDPTSDFCKQSVGAKDTMGTEQLDKLIKGNVSKRSIEKVFGFTNKEDQGFMQQILNAMMNSPLGSHPMCKSLGLGGSKRSGAFDPSQFPKLSKGMPGFGGSYAGGQAGGLPFDQTMPACPFMGGNLDQFFGGKRPQPSAGPEKPGAPDKPDKPVEPDKPGAPKK